MPRSWSARLAVLAVSIPIVVTLRSAAGSDGCVPTATGIDCSFGGTTTSTTVTQLPPLRYLATMTHPLVGPCWFWSRHPPGLDSLDAGNDQAIILTRASLPECPTATTGGEVVDTAAHAWDVFRSWSLARPEPRLRPTTGITNLATILTLTIPEPLDHSETLPDGRRLDVRASVDAVVVTWGDGTPPVAYPPATFGRGASHTYRLKTCSASYRASHPSGHTCHPSLNAYPVSISFTWVGRYRVGGSWTVLGTIPRSTSRSYEVDEVVGIPVSP